MRKLSILYFAIAFGGRLANYLWIHKWKLAGGDKEGEKRKKAATVLDSLSKIGFGLLFLAGMDAWYGNYDFASSVFFYVIVNEYAFLACLCAGWMFGTWGSNKNNI